MLILRGARRWHKWRKRKGSNLTVCYHESRLFYALHSHISERRGPFLGWITLFAIAFSLSLDAFAVATVAGITLGEPSRRQRFRLSFHFGIFQAMMLTGGWCLGSAVVRLMHGLDAWVAFALLALVGGNIVRNSLSSEEDDRRNFDPTRGCELLGGIALIFIGLCILWPALRALRF